MTVTSKKSEKRHYIESDDEMMDEEEKAKPLYHKCVIDFIQKVFGIANTKLGLFFDWQFNGR